MEKLLFTTYDLDQAIRWAEEQANLKLDLEDIEQVEAAWGLERENVWDGGALLRVEGGRWLYLASWLRGDQHDWTLGGFAREFSERPSLSALSEFHREQRPEADASPGVWDRSPSNLTIYVKEYMRPREETNRWRRLDESP